MEDSCNCREMTLEEMCQQERVAIEEIKGNLIRIINNHQFDCEESKLKGDNIPSFIDWKTSNHTSKVWALQLAAYTHLAGLALNIPTEIRSLAIRLDKNGGMPKVTEYTQWQRPLLDCFMCARRLYWFTQWESESDWGNI